MIPYLHAIWTEWGGVLRIDRFIDKLDHRGKGDFLVINGVFFYGGLFSGGIEVP